MKDENFGKRFLTVNLPNHLAVAFYCFMLVVEAKWLSGMLR